MKAVKTQHKGWVEDILGGPDELKNLCDDAASVACNYINEELYKRGIDDMEDEDGDDIMNDMVDAIWKHMCKTIK